MAPKQYKRRVALFLAWAEESQKIGKRKDPLGITKEMESLRRVLTNGYGFEIFTHRIELYRPQPLVREKVRNFIRGYSDPDTLLLLYYGGHGSYRMPYGLIWTARKHDIPGVLARDRSFACRYILEDLVKASSDVLILLCCCDAAPSHPEMAINCDAEGGVTEIIGACSVGQRTAAEYAPQLISLLERRFISGKQTLIRDINSDLPKGAHRFVEGLFSGGRNRPAPGLYPEAAYLQLHGQSPADSIVLSPVVPTPSLIFQEPRYAMSSIVAKFKKLCGKGLCDWKPDGLEEAAMIY